MPGRKKSRKTGPIGVRKSNTVVPKETGSPRRKKKSSGRPAGSRHNIEQKTSQRKKAQGNKDPRLGSKTPVPLNPIEKVVSKDKAVPVYFSPKEELAALENDPRLTDLLDKVENDIALNSDDTLYFETKMHRHAQLCELLGIALDDDDPEQD